MNRTDFVVIRYYQSRTQDRIRQLLPLATADTFLAFTSDAWATPLRPLSIDAPEHGFHGTTEEGFPLQVTRWSAHAGVVAAAATHHAISAGVLCAACTVSLPCEADVSAVFGGLAS